MTQKNEKNEIKEVELSSGGSNNTVLIIVFSIVILVLLATAALGWGLFLYGKYETKQKAAKPNLEIGMPNRETANPPSEKNYPAVGSENLNQNRTQSPQNNSFATPPSSTTPVNSEISSTAETPAAEEGSLSPSVTEKNIGYLKKVYPKNGQHYLDIDYIQWLTGTTAEKALREDGQCPQKGECVVYNDYYIRNQNPLVRTFVIAPEAVITMQTLDSEKTGDVNQNRKITFEQLKNIFDPASSYKERYQYVPFIIEIDNKQITKITEQYIP